MKHDVAKLVAKCLTCQQVRIEHQHASGFLQPLDIPTWKWDQISMDFVTGLPRTSKKNDAIWVVLDQLTKSAYFLPIQKGLHGTRASIVSDKDPCFTSRFWKRFVECFRNAADSIRYVEIVIFGIKREVGTCTCV
ncbi:retrotransposable element Tf2 [Tanacetum coccineum]